MFAKRYFARRYFAARYWAGAVAIQWTTFAGRGPGADGSITPILDDYSSFYITPGYGDEIYLQSVPDECLTQDEADERYLQSVPIEYITQAEADAQGMPGVEAGGTGDTSSRFREVDTDFTLLAVSSPALYQQAYFNISNSVVVARKPTGYLDTLGSTSISPNTSALFIKRSGSAQFRRW